MNNTRLKLGIGIFSLGLVIQFFIELNRTSEKITNSGALLACITYGTLGNDCQERYSVAANPIGWLIAFVGFLFIIGHITGKVAFNKGRDYSSFFLLGFFFGLIGLFISLLLGEKSTQKVEIVNPDRMQGDTKKCKFCAEEIKKDAIFCKHCKNNLD
jgi:hypothetical protein